MALRKSPSLYSAVSADPLPVVAPAPARHLSLHQPEPGDWQYISRTLDRECRKLGGSRGVHAVGGSGSLMLQLDEEGEAGGQREE